MIDQQIKLSNWGGVVTCCWNQHQFKKIVKILRFDPEIYNYESKAFYRNYSEPYSCRVRILENGKLLISGAKSKQSMQQLLIEKIICKVMQKMPNTNISIVQDLSVTSCQAVIAILYQIDLILLQQTLSESMNVKIFDGQVQLPQSIHKIPKVSILLTQREIIIKKAHLAEDIYLLGLYIQIILRPFQKLNKGVNSSIQKSKLDSIAQKMQYSCPQIRRVDSQRENRG